MKTNLSFCFYRKQLLAYSFAAIVTCLASCSGDGYEDGDPTPTNYTLSATLTSGAEVPSNGSSATGTLTGTYNPSTYKVSYTVTWTGLTGAPTGMHFHGPAAVTENAAVLVAIPGYTATTAGSYTGMADFTAGQGTNLTEGKVYVNIHSATYPGGEIRGQITATH